MRFRKLLQDMQKEPDIRQALFTKESEMQFVFSQLLQALEEDDVLLLADLLEEALVPLIKVMIIPPEVVGYGEFQLEPTSSGYLTVKHLPSNLYLHSNGNPMEEARILIDSCYNPSKSRYLVWGCGLGYHVAKLYEAARGAISIMVFDEEETILQLAKESGILKDIPKDRITFVKDTNGKKFVQHLDEKEVGILLHFPSIKKIQNKELKSAMHGFFSAWNSSIQFQRDFAVNFRSNVQNCPYVVDELIPDFEGKEVVLVAAGPSLDHSIEFVKNSLGTRVVVCVTTVLKKLLKAGVVPDYAIVMDPQKRTLGHIEGIEDCKVPLIVDSTAYWEFAQKYAGKKFIAYQKGYEKAEKVAKRLQYKLYETGGTVVTLALDYALQSGAKKVYLVGVDLAYPKGISHASGTMDMGQRETAGMEKVKSVNGDEVYADTLFIEYRKWIERKIAKYPQIDVYNLSNCGAEIRGTKQWKEGVR